MDRESGESGRLEAVEVPVLREGGRVWTVRLQGEPDADYGYVFSPEEADRWARKRRALLALRQLERQSGLSSPGTRAPVIATRQAVRERGASTSADVVTYRAGPVGRGPAAPGQQMPLPLPTSR